MRLRAALANGADAPHALKLMSSKNSARRRRLLGTGGSLRSRLLHECRARDGSSPKDSSVLAEVQDALWEGRTVAGGWWDGGGWGWACRCPRALLSKAEAATSRQDTSALSRCSSQRGHGQTQAASLLEERELTVKVAVKPATPQRTSPYPTLIFYIKPELCA